MVDSGFAAALKGRRAASRLSQLDLALRAGTTQRHLSFLESGRSRPGRDVVVRLAHALGLPLREANVLLFEAGFAPAFSHNPVDSDQLAPAMSALSHIVQAHSPYPAIVVNRYGDIIVANDDFDWLLGSTPEPLRSNAYRAALHPEGMAARVVNYAEWAAHIVHSLQVSFERGPDERLAAILDELQELIEEQCSPARSLGFAAPLCLRADGAELQLMTTVSSFATAVDVTLSELKLEAFLPADAASADMLRSRPRR